MRALAGHLAEKPAIRRELWAGIIKGIQNKFIRKQCRTKKMRFGGELPGPGFLVKGF